MGGGTWTTSAYNSYMTSMKNISNVATLNCSTVNQFYDARELDPMLDPYGIKVRECLDSDDHPSTIPVILALDVTGSMGSACAAVARQLDSIITSLYEKVKDVEIMVMGIGDFSYDNAPLQVSQFESDIRICDQLGKIWFERGGGGNSFESYTAAWYFASRHTKLDCWNRGQRGILISIGDEPLNMYLPRVGIERFIGDTTQGDIETDDLYEEVTEKYDVFHVVITDKEASSAYHMNNIDKTWGNRLDGQHLFKCNSNELPQLITDIVTGGYISEPKAENTEGIAW